jgi:tRNA U54 and U55 pseudouridine synthase Pus10
MMWLERRHVTMKDLLSKIYDYVINYEDDSIKLGSKFNVEVKKAIEPLKESMTAEEMERIKEIVYLTAYTAEKNGFYLGIRTALGSYELRR